ncbi:MAG: Dyp-type peroxidase, partial [Xylophilus sp.]|nr:Dyp-type peroxidase [Xylophilus sp.]
MHTAQAAILATVPPVGRYVFFNLAANVTPATLRDSLSRLAPLVDGDHTLLAVGPQLVAALGATVPGLREFPAMTGHGADVPSTPTALCCWLRGDEKGDLLLQARAIEKALAPALHFHRAVDAFRYKLGASGHGRDLTGYEDGTENPDGDEAVEAALVQGQGAGL